MQYKEPDFSRKLNVSLRARVTLIVVMTPEEERVVSKIQEVCDTWDPPRQCVTWDSVEGFSVIAGNKNFHTQSRDPLAALDDIHKTDENAVIQQLAETWRAVSRKNFQESYHDALQLKEEATGLFNLGLLDLRGRARVEQLFWGCCEAILKIIRELDYVPDDLEGLEKGLADTYYGNFSVFQSAPDHWAVKQLFPTIPIHRLNQQPLRRGIIADLTCDSDGKIDQFIDLRDVKGFLELHTMNGGEYLLATFLVGAYQEILGDLHNLFGDTDAVHVKIADDDYTVEKVVKGDSVSEVLSYVQYNKDSLVSRVRRSVEAALREKRITMAESGRFMKRYEEALEGYTYLSVNQ